MNRNRKTTPQGTRDLLFEECRARRQAQERLAALFERRGFSEVMTPGIEFYDVFQSDPPAIPTENMYKLTDLKGRLLVMRPDSTLPIARLAATRLQNETLPLRLHYAQDVYCLNHGLTGHSDQQFQAGVELIGAGGVRADLEVISLSAQALAETAGDGFRLEIGHVGVFRTLLAELAAPEKVRAELHELIESKSYAAVGDLLDTLPPSAAAAAIRRLPRLFGGEEVLHDQTLCCIEACRPALDYLSGLYEKLCKLGLSEQIMLDLGMVHRNEYYTGVIFRGYIEGSGDAVMSGGRYDALLREFGSPLPATGFGVNIDRVTAVLLARGDTQPRRVPQMLIFAENGYEAAALRELQSLPEDMIAEFSPFDTAERSRAYATERGIRTLQIVGDCMTEETL